MKKIPWLLFIILAIAFFLRIFRLEELFYFMMDEALLAFRGWGIFALRRPFLIGGISPLGFHLPPYFYWLSALFLAFFNFSPLVWGVVGAITGVVTVFALFLLARRIGGTKIGLVTAAVYSTSFVAIFFDRHYWPLVFNPFLTILTLYLLAANYRYKWIFLALVLVFAVSADPSNLTLLILVGYSLLKEKLSLRKSLLFFVTFTLLFVGPLLLFDLRHKGNNIAGVARFFKQTKELKINKERFISAFLLPPRTLSRFWYSPQADISKLHTYCSGIALARQVKQPVFLQFLALVVLIIYYFSKRKAKESGEIYIARLLLIYLLGLLVYGSVLGRPIYDHYLAGLLPIFALITAKVFVRFWVIGLFVFLFLCASNLNQFAKAENPYGLGRSNKAVQWVIENVDNESFALDTISKCYRYNGLRYLFEIKDKPPSISFIDVHFFWLYREKPAEVFPRKVVVFVDSLSYQKFEPSLPVVSQDNFGAWQVYVLDNSKKTYEIQF